MTAATVVGRDGLALTVRSKPWWFGWREENRDWGYRRILGALTNLGHHVARGKIANILKQHGLEPAPERSRKTTWKEFLTRHWELIVCHFPDQPAAS